jgi:hypothetical protein
MLYIEADSLLVFVITTVGRPSIAYAGEPGRPDRANERAHNGQDRQRRGGARSNALESLAGVPGKSAIPI